MKVGYFQFDTTNPYQQLFFQSVRQSGAQVVPLAMSRSSPLRQLDDVDVIHFDWLHPFYASRRGRLVRVYKTWSVLRALRSIKRTGRPKLVHTIHNLSCHDSYLPPQKESQIVGQMFGVMDALVAFSPAVFDEVDRHWSLDDRQPRFVIPHGHYIDSYDEPLGELHGQECCRQELKIPEDVPVVLFFGHLRESKGILDLLSVFPEVHRTTGAILVVAGRCDSATVATALSESDQQSVRVFGEQVSDSDLPRYYAAADVVALPFQSILNSGSAILAQSMGKYSVMPKIATLTANLDVNAIATYAAGDLQALKAALATAVQIPRADLAARGAAAREYLKQELDWKKIGRLATEMYETVAGD